MSHTAPMKPSHQFLEVGQHFEQKHQDQNDAHIEPGQRRLLEAELQQRPFDSKAEEREELPPMQGYYYEKAHQRQHFQETGRTKYMSTFWPAISTVTFRC